jgi:hypothetical protein
VSLRTSGLDEGSTELKESECGNLNVGWGTITLCQDHAQRLARHGPFSIMQRWIEPMEHVSGDENTLDHQPMAPPICDFTIELEFHPSQVFSIHEWEQRQRVYGC